MRNGWLCKKNSVKPLLLHWKSEVSSGMEDHAVSLHSKRKSRLVFVVFITMNGIHEKKLLFDYSALIIMCVVSFVYSQNQDVVTPEQTPCSASVSINYRTGTQTICLNRLIPAGDSCAYVEFVFQDSNNTRVSFSYDSQKRRWSYNDVSVNDSSLEDIAVEVEVINNENGNLEEAILQYRRAIDSLEIDIESLLSSDRKVIPDTLMPQTITIKQYTYPCQEKKSVVVHREFSYPAGYMRRGPDYNYPELSAFHHGGSIRFPTSGSLMERAYLIHHWHILHPTKKLEYDDLEHIRKTETLYNRLLAKHEKRRSAKRSKKKKKKRKRRIFITPIY